MSLLVSRGVNSSLKFQLQAKMGEFTRNQEIVNACENYNQFKTLHGDEFVAIARNEGFAGLKAYWRHCRVKPSTDSSS